MPVNGIPNPFGETRHEYMSRPNDTLFKSTRPCIYNMPVAGISLFPTFGRPLNLCPTRVSLIRLSLPHANAFIIHLEETQRNMNEIEEARNKMSIFPYMAKAFTWR